MANQNVRLGRGWEEDFSTWSGELLLGRKQKKPAQARKPHSSWTGVAMPVREIQQYSGRGSKSDIRARLAAVAKRHQQVIVKIPTKGRKTAKQLNKHLEYLTRDYEETLADQSGQAVAGREGVRDLAWAWKHTGPQLDDDSDRKVALHVIFSMREGTDEKAVYAAVRATAEFEFAGHQWVMVQHFDEPQVHVHVCVKMEALDGRRLDPRQADLHRWRERFAYELRERGVEAEATRRAPRLKREKVNTPWAAAQLQKRGEPTNPAPATPSAERAAGWRRAENDVVDYYGKIIAALSRSDEGVDRQLARELERTVTAAAARNKATERTHERTRSPQLDRS